MENKKIIIGICCFVVLSMISHQHADNVAAKNAEENAARQQEQQNNNEQASAYTEPYFGTCEKRAAFGYNYPLYFWQKEYYYYNDADNDGKVCE